MSGACRSRHGLYKRPSRRHGKGSRSRKSVGWALITRKGDRMTG